MTEDTAPQDWQTQKNTLLERNTYMFNNDLLSDVSFLVGHDENSAKKIPAHKYVLSISSPVFFNMFTGDLAEKGQTIRIPDSDPDSFLEFLRYLYTDEVNLSNCVQGVLYLANKYIVPSLTRLCVTFLNENLNADNVLGILGQGIRYDDKELLEKCWTLIEDKTSDVLRSEEFLDASYDILERIYTHDVLAATELELFVAMDKWAEKQCQEKGIEEKRTVLNDLIYHIHYPSLSSEDFVCTVLVAGILDGGELSQIGQVWKNGNMDSSQALKYRQSPHQKPLKYISRFPNKGAVVKELLSYAVTIDGISFSVDKSIWLVGARFYGDEDLSEYKTSLKLLDENEECLAEIPTKSYKSSIERGYSGYSLCFDHPVRLKRNKIYHLEASIQGPDSYYGENGQSKVIFEGYKFKFYDYKPSNELNPTSVSRGDIPELMFY